MSPAQVVPPVWRLGHINEGKAPACVGVRAGAAWLFDLPKQMVVCFTAIAVIAVIFLRLLASIPRSGLCHRAKIYGEIHDGFHVNDGFWRVREIEGRFDRCINLGAELDRDIGIRAFAGFPFAVCNGAAVSADVAAVKARIIGVDGHIRIADAQIAIALVAIPLIAVPGSPTSIPMDASEVSPASAVTSGQHGRGHKQTRKNRNTGLHQPAL